MPRIPRGYAKYLARTSGPQGYRVDTQVMAPTRASALRYINERYSPAVRDEVVSLEELYGPYFPSEERMIHPRGLSSAYMRELERRRQEAIDNYYRFTPFEDRLPSEDVADFADHKARYDLEDYLGTRPSSLPVVPQREFSYVTPGGRFYRYNAFGPEGVRDRVRMRGVDEDDIGMVENLPFTNIPRGF